MDAMGTLLGTNISPRLKAFVKMSFFKVSFPRGYPRYSMGLAYLPPLFTMKNESFMSAKYTSPMEPMGYVLLISVSGKNK